MDLESECSGHESVEDNGVITPERSGRVEEADSGNNGSCVGEHEHEHEHERERERVGDDKLLGEMGGKVVGVVETVNLPLETVRSPGGGGSVGSSPPAMRKGYGLKKWRRFKRDFSKDESSGVDTSKILKRGLPNSVANSSKPRNSTVAIRGKSEGSISSTNAIVRSPAVNLDPKLGNGPGFGASTDSENSEDRSSKSSTAASVPKLRYEIPMTRSPIGKNLGSSVQRGQHGKGQVETSKKPRGGERDKIEKENSHSSMESDSRSSNFVFLQGANSITSNGRQRPKSANYDIESDYEAKGSELRTGYGEENVGDYEGTSREREDINADLSWEAKQEESENHGSCSDPDPLVESILALQSAEEALEKELEKFRETGMEKISLFDGSTTISYEQLHTEEIGQCSFDSSETGVLSLKQNVRLLERKLDEARAAVKTKEAKVIELEANLETSKSLYEEPEKYREPEAELDGIFKQKIESEVEYLAISSTTQEMKTAVSDYNMVFEEIVLEQTEILNQLGDAESVAVKLERQAEKLETCCTEIVEADEVLKLQNRVLKTTWCLLIQLVLLVVVLVLFVSQLSPGYTGVVPT